MVVTLAMVSCGGNANKGVREAQELSGAGATFPLPFYNVVFPQNVTRAGYCPSYGIDIHSTVRNIPAPRKYRTSAEPNRKQIHT